MSEAGSKLNQIMIFENRKLATLVADNPGTIERAMPIIEELAKGMHHTVALTCPDGEACASRIDWYSNRVSEFGITVIAMGVICTKSSLGCPKNMRIEL